MKKIKGEYCFDYDFEDDILDLYIEKPVPAKSLEMGNGILIRINPDTNEIVGFTIIDYEWRKEKGLLKQIPYFEDIQLPEYKSCA